MVDDVGIITTEQAAALLMLPAPVEVTRLSKEGWFKSVGPDRWRVVDVVQGHIRSMRAQVDTCTTKELATASGYTVTAVYAIADQGYIKPISKNKWPRAESFRGIFRYLRDENRRSAKSSADGRVRDARAAEIELRNQERLRHLIRLEEAIEALDNVCGKVRTEMSSVPSRVTRDLHLRRDIEKAIHEALGRIADMLDSESAALSQGRKASKVVAAYNA